MKLTPAPLIVLLALLFAASPADAAKTKPQTRYSLVHGCYALKANGKALPGAGHVRMQATALGSYLLYLPDRTFLAAQDGAVAPASEPSPAADWTVKKSGKRLFTLTPKSGGGPTLKKVRFVRAKKCATYPEAALDAKGRPKPAATSFGSTKGVVEGHMHWMTYEFLGGKFHCGRPWHPYGIPYALPDCSSVEGPQGSAAPFQNFLNYGNPSQPHDTSGYPQLKEWSASNLTYEGTYWRWIQRSYLGGMRLMVMGINENRVLCELQANKETNCNEMDTVRRGLKDIRDLQHYVDAQAGGPGKGFFQIVTNPYDARRVINQGRMAVVLEIEVSEPFDCRGWDQPSCNQQQVDKQFNEMKRLGVRSMLLLNKFDNPLTGVRFDSGQVGYVINAGNKQSAGSFWSARTCTGKLHDNEIYQPDPQTGAGLNTLLTAAGLGGSAPAYPPAPHCNTRGLTDLGKHVVRRMMDSHMIVNPDHMSQAGVDETLSLLEARRYSGVISPHGWMDPGNWPRLWKLGGVAFPGHSTAESYVKDWKQYRPRQTPYKFGWGYGADLGGLSHQPDASSDGSKFKYPFKSYDGRVTFKRQRTGERTFDYGREGVAHYGLYADWFHDLSRRGGRRLVSDMMDGSEAYLDMWERADGVRVPKCADSDDSLTASGRPVAASGGGALLLGTSWRTLLRRVGQPQQRTRAWSYCVAGKRNRRAADVAVLGARSGKVELVGSTAFGRSAGGVRVGAPARRAGGGGIHRRGRWVYAARGGKVVAVAVSTPSLVRNPKALRAAMQRVLRAKASAVPRKFVPSAATAGARGRVTGKPLAGTSDPKLNAALAMLCNLQMGGTAAASPR
jgi:hypothetical protein